MKLFKKKTYSIEPLALFQSEEAKWDNIKKRISSVADGNSSEIFVCHFHDSMTQLKDCCASVGIERPQHLDSLSVMDFESVLDKAEAQVFTAFSWPISIHTPVVSSAHKKKLLRITFVELAPSWSREQLLEDLYSVSGLHLLIQKICSQEDPVLRQVFQDPTFSELMGKLDMPESEGISHSFLSSAVIKLQKQIAKTSHGDGLTADYPAWCSAYTK